MKRLNRRSFLKSSILTTTTVGLWPPGSRARQASAQSSAVARVRSANDEIGYAVVGFHGRGADHLKGMSGVKGTRLVALCDVDSHVLENEVKRCENKGEKVKGYTDIRKLLEDSDVDVITIATPNHWHSLAAFWAVQAGKDVY